jgi:hypothetical protein
MSTTDWEKQIEEICVSWDDEYNLGKQDLKELVTREIEAARQEGRDEAVKVFVQSMTTEEKRLWKGIIQEARNPKSHD